MYLLRLAVVFFIFVYPQNVIADAIYEHFDDGVVAFKKGDYKTAENEFIEAAETGDYRAMTILGHMYFEGIGMDKDYKKAYKRFSQAAKYNFTQAEYLLGLMYDEGLGVSQNYKKAARLYKKAAKRGYAPAQHRLGMLYARGHGIGQSNIKAYAWIVVASGVFFSDVLPEVKEEGAETKQGSDELELIRRIRKEMTPEQEEETKRLIRTNYKYRKKYRVLELNSGGLSSEDEYLYFPEYFYQIID